MRRRAARRSRSGAAWASGLAAGAGLMYWLDPAAGRRRRARAREKLTHVGNQVSAATGTVSRDVEHRTQGLLAHARDFLRELGGNPEPVTDERLVQRVRQRLGRVCSHPRAIEVASHEGRITLRGHIFKDEVARVLAGIHAIRGVDSVISELVAHDHGEHVPALQGGSTRSGPVLDIMQETWAPATRALAAGTGLVLFGRALRGGPVGWASGLAGAALLARTGWNRPLRSVLGRGGMHPEVVLHKTLHVRANVEDCFALFGNLEAFPRFMPHVLRISAQGEGRHDWEVKGPAGVHVSFTTELVRHEPNRAIAWRTVPGGRIDHEGEVRFFPDGDGRTRIEVQMAYRPPLGLVGHSVAHLMGHDPKQQMDADLLRLKSLLEQGKATGSRETVTRDEVLGRGRDQ